MRIDDPIIDREEEITGLEEISMDSTTVTTVTFEVVNPSRGQGVINFLRKIFGG